MKSITLLIATSALVLSLLTSVGLFVSTSYAQGNQTNATTAGNETRGNQTGNQSGNPLQELLGGLMGGGQ